MFTKRKKHSFFLTKKSKTRKRRRPTRKRVRGGCGCSSKEQSGGSGFLNPASFNAATTNVAGGNGDGITGGNFYSFNSGLGGSGDPITNQFSTRMMGGKKRKKSKIKKSKKYKQKGGGIADQLFYSNFEGPTNIIGGNTTSSFGTSNALFDTNRIFGGHLQGNSNPLSQPINTAFGGQTNPMV